MRGRAKLGTIGKDVDEAMEAIEDLNPGLRGVLPILKKYGYPPDKQEQAIQLVMPQAANLADDWAQE